MRFCLGILPLGVKATAEAFVALKRLRVKYYFNLNGYVVNMCTSEPKPQDSDCSQYLDFFWFLLLILHVISES